jgi:hypothetical protein
MNGKLQKMIQEILGIQPDKINIIPNSIPLETQIEYFETSKKVKENINYEVILKNAEWLFNRDISIPDKKYLLAQLASISKPEAYRLIERYLQSPDPELVNWARLAYIESRILLESEFLNENQIIISTGLGGENNLLRYFVVFKIINSKIDEGQIKLIELETQSVIESFKGKIEEFNVNLPYVALLILLDFNSDLKNVFKTIIQNCKEYEINIDEKYIITNVKKLNQKEIAHFFDGISDDK